MPNELDEFKGKIKQSYMEGLEWVMQYYYKGCASWSWYYPYHYAPFASDLTGVADMKLEFDMDAPSRPFEQLMSVFPKGSSHAIPKCYRDIMLDNNSSISDFYPETFKVDLNGHRFAWMGVVLLPFIDRLRLREAMAPHHDELTAEEKERNTNGIEKIICEAKDMVDNRNITTIVELKHGDGNICGKSFGF